MATAPRDLPSLDVHSHFVPKAYRDALEKAGLAVSDIFPLPRWNVRQHLEDMERMNVGAAVLSLSSPDVHWGDHALARRIARQANETAADAVRSHPERFGFFATLPLPDVEGSLAEIEYAFDVLGADGVKVYSNNNGVYLGDPQIEPIFAELGRREAVVALHPTKPKTIPKSVLVGVPYPLFEFHYETTRAVANLILTGTLRRSPGVRFICPHMGAVLPLLAGRMEAVFQAMGPLGLADEGFVPPDVRSELGSLYYDSAGGFDLPIQIPALRGITSPAYLLYGSDYPFTAAPRGAQLLDELRTTHLLSDDEIAGVLRGNALRLFPRFGLSEARERCR